MTPHAKRELLGDNCTTQGAAPVVTSLSGSVVTAIVAGGQHSLALKSNKTVLVWGSNNKGQAGNNDATHTAAITTKRTISTSYTYDRYAPEASHPGTRNLELIRIVG